MWSPTHVQVLGESKFKHLVKTYEQLYFFVFSVTRRSRGDVGHSLPYDVSSNLTDVTLVTVERG